MPTVLITTEPLQNRPGPHLEQLLQAGFDVRYRVESTILTEADTAEALDGAEAVIAGSERYTPGVLSRCPRLRVISRNGVGYDCIDLPAATQHGVAVTITPDGNHEAVAEHTLALLLTMTRLTNQHDRDVRRGIWVRHELTPLRHKTLGIVGLGRIGRSVAARAAAFQLRLLAHDICPDEAFAESHGVELVELDSLLSRSDFVSLHVPASAETSGLINRKALARMRRGSFLINTARGALVVEEDLVAALRSGHLGGAGLDVFEDEPPVANHPLFGLDNVILSPHAAAHDSQAVHDMAIAAAQNIVDIYRGNWPNGSLLNPTVKHRWTR